MKQVIIYLRNQKTAIATIATAVLLAIADGLRQGHVVWSTVGYAALVALAGIAHSALGPGNTPSLPGSTTPDA